MINNEEKDPKNVNVSQDEINKKIGNKDPLYFSGEYYNGEINSKD